MSLLICRSDCSISFDDLHSRFIELYSILGDLVVDPFAGHGTTLVEARKLGRRALGYDLEQSCVDQANSALAKAT